MRAMMCVLIAAALQFGVPAIAPTGARPDGAVHVRNRAPPVEGVWSTDDIAIRSATCPVPLTNSVRERIHAGAWQCTFTIQPYVGWARVLEECPDRILEFTAELDSGRLYRVERTEMSGGTCHGLLSNSFSADLTTTPASISVKYDFDFDNDCGIGDCSIVIGGQLHRIEIARLRRGGAR